jgi:hypothetical protein
MPFEQRSHLVESYFLFEVVWINHTAKLVQAEDRTK